MTDPLTDAVRRIKQLQQDVERLKAGQDEEGQPRIFIEEQDRAASGDTANFKAADVAVGETANAADSRDVPVGETVAPAYWNTDAAGWSSLTYSDG